jgi:hypothetical protein
LLPAEKWEEINRLFSSDEPMNWDDIRTLRGYGAGIGSHCHDHCILHAHQESDVIRQQLEMSKRMIEDQVGAPCQYFAYPNGTKEDMTPEACAAIERRGYRMAFTTILGETTRRVTPYLTPRLVAPFEFEEFVYSLNSLSRHTEDHYKFCASLSVPTADGEAGKYAPWDYAQRTSVL